MSRTVDPSRRAPRRHGFTLVELMIALALTALVIAAIAGVFLSARETFRTSDGVARLQENARAVAALLSREVREAGRAGCASARQFSVIASAPPDLAPYTAATARSPIAPAYFFSAHDCDAADCTPALPAGITLPAPRAAPGARVPGSDVIVTRRLDGDGVPLAAPMADASAPLRVDLGAAGWSSLKPGEILVVADCEAADWFRVTSVDANGIGHALGANRSAALGHAYGRSGDARVFRLDTDLVTAAHSLAYATTPEDDTALLGALRRFDGNRSEELLQGVDDLQVQLLVDAGAGTFAVRSPGALATPDDWGRVVRADVRVVVDSVVAPNVAPEPFAFDGAPRDPWTLAAGADRRLHREVHLPIVLRNRMP